MGKEFFIADIHDKDNNILTYEHRPFKDIEEMHQILVQNWNNTVSKDDTVYLLGDIGNIDILSELNGHIIIVAGNHDNVNEIKKRYPNIEIYPYPIMVGNFWLSHKPIGYMPPECPYLNIHGHLHRFNYGFLDRTWDGGNRYFCVSVEQINYNPITIEEINKTLQYKMEGE